MMVMMVVAMVSGDPATLMIELCKGLKGYNCAADWVDTLKERDIEKEKVNRYLLIVNCTPLFHSPVQFLLYCIVFFKSTGYAVKLNPSA